MPLALTRTYNSQDTFERAFGFGMTHGYGVFQFSAHQFAEGDFILPDDSVGYDSTGRASGLTDPLGHHTTLLQYC